MGTPSVKGKSRSVGEGVTPVDPNAAILASWALSLHGKADGTRKLYLRVVGWFVDWLEANGRPEGAPGDLLAVSRQDAEAWFGAQRADGLKPTTLRSRWIALRNLYGWLHDEDELDANPLAKVRVEKVEPPPIEVLTEADLRSLLKVCEGKGFLERRDLAIVRLLAATGMRLSELASLRVADVDLAKRVAFIEHGKGDKARFVRFDAGTATAIDRYLRARGRHPKAGLPWLWVSRSGRFTNKGVPLMLVRRSEQAGVGHVHAHMFRHTWADAWLSAGGNEGDLQRLGGWENADVMRRYGSARAVDRALAAYDDVNPLGEL
jgi:site-specific recombinase XerD